MDLRRELGEIRVNPSETDFTAARNKIEQTNLMKNALLVGSGLLALWVVSPTLIEAARYGFSNWFGPRRRPHYGSAYGPTYGPGVNPVYGNGNNYNGNNFPRNPNSFNRNNFNGF